MGQSTSEYLMPEIYDPLLETYGLGVSVLVLGENTKRSFPGWLLN